MQHNQRQPSIRIVSFMAFETGTYNTVYDRPYKSNITQDSINKYDEVTQGGRLINTGTLSTLAPQILAPSAVAGSPIIIPQGWGQSRYRFVMVLEEQQGIGGSMMHILTGYTDHNEAVGLSEQTINPNINLYFNTCVSVNVMHNLATMNHSASSHGRIVDNYHIITRPIDTQPIRGFTGDGPTSLRPSDVVDQMSTDLHSLSGGPSHSLCNGLMTDPIIRSSRNYNAAPTYLAETLQAINYSAKTFDNSINNQQGTSPYDNAIGSLQEPAIRSDKFMQMLISRTNISRDGSVTWGMLKSMFPYLEDPNVTNFKRHDLRRTDVMISRAGGTEFWQSSTAETHIAARIAASVPSAMISALVGVANFHVTNMNNKGIEVAVTHALPLLKIVSVDMMSAVEQLKQQIIIDIFNAVSDNNRIPLEASIRCDVMGDLFISIQFNCQPKVDYILPTFADHLFTPILSRTRTRLNEMAHDMSLLANVSAVSNAQVMTNPATGSILPLASAPTNPTIYNGPSYLNQQPVAPPTAPSMGSVSDKPYGI